MGSSRVSFLSALSAGFLLLLLCAFGASSSAQAQTAPPAVTFFTPRGMERGTTATVTIEGINLGGASQIIFSDPRVTGKILSNTEFPKEKIVIPKGVVFTGTIIEDTSTRNRLKLEVSVPADCELARLAFRVRTPLGTTNTVSLLLGTLDEIAEMEPNDSRARAQKITLPATINGAIENGSDSDHFQFEAKAGDELVFEVAAAQIQSALDSVLTLYDAKGNQLSSNDDFGRSADSILGYRFEEAGIYTIRVADAQAGGSRRHFYRLSISDLPLVTSIFPLGLRQGTSAELAIDGFNLQGAKRVKLQAQGPASGMKRIPVEFATAKGAALKAPRAALGQHPEILERGGNGSIASAQAVVLPVTINGRLEGEKGGAVEDHYRFSAQKGERISIEVHAERLGSALDSVIEVLDAKGREIPRAVIRPVLQTFLTLRDHDSSGGGMRIESYTGLAPGDFLMVGGELVQVNQLPYGPDDDIKFRSYRGQRITYEGTSPEGHALGSAVYKVEIHKPGTAFTPNGMPVATLYYRNDDGGPTYGKDSHLIFVAPEDGDYYVRLKDVRGESGREYAYRLTLAAPEPDFALAVRPANPNLARGARVPITVMANRIEGFDGPIEVELADLPPGLSSMPVIIPPGENQVVLVLAASADANLPETGVPLRVVGRARIDGREVTRTADPEDALSLITLSSAPDVELEVKTGDLVVEPGGRVEVRVEIRRANGFTGRVPIEVKNLPHGVWVPDIGLNGILITEAESSRTFQIEVMPTVKPMELTLFMTARVETTSPIPAEQASVPVRLRIREKNQSDQQSRRE